MPSSKTEEVTVDLAEMNHSELVLLARWLGMRVSRAIPRHVLVDALQEFKVIDFRSPIDSYRKTLSTWLQRHWDRLQMQAPKDECPHCELCGDLQALDCFLLNRSRFRVDDGG